MCLKMKNLEENSALQTRNAELIRNALPSMPEPVKRFLAELGKKISPEMYADILNLDISLLSKVLFGLKFLSPEEQILLPTMSPSDLQNLFVNLATAHYQLIT